MNPEQRHKCEKGSQERTLNSQKNSRLFAEKDNEWKARQNSKERGENSRALRGANQFILSFQEFSSAEVEQWVKQDENDDN